MCFVFFKNVFELNVNTYTFSNNRIVILQRIRLIGVFKFSIFAKFEPISRKFVDKMRQKYNDIREYCCRTPFKLVANFDFRKFGPIPVANCRSCISYFVKPIFKSKFYQTEPLVQHRVSDHH